MKSVCVTKNADNATINDGAYLKKQREKSSLPPSSSKIGVEEWGLRAFKNYNKGYRVNDG